MTLTTRTLLTRTMPIIALLARVAHADPASEPQAPSWLAGTPRTPDLEHKVEGIFPDALPLIAYDPNTGLGLGVGGHLTIDGPRNDALFDYAPYQHRLYLQIYATTLGYQGHFLSYDGIFVGHSPYHINAVFFYERNTYANYFGNGQSTLSNLNFRGQSFQTYEEAASVAGPRYYHYGYERPQGQVTIERPFFGGKVRVHYGINVQYVDVTVQDSVFALNPASGGPSPTVPSTKLGADCATGAAVDCNGGWNNLLRTGIAYDTRDYAPDPKSGVFLDATGQWSAKAFGSTENYVRLTTAARFYVSPFPKLTDLVLAVRGLYSVQSANVPFYAMNNLAMGTGTDDVTGQQGLGGERTLRGYRQDRFIGHVDAAFNAELRWTFAKFDLLKQHFSLQVAPIFDAGTVFDRVTLAPSTWKVDGGGALRIGWNQSTIIMLDFAASKEDVGEYIDFGMPF
jgi:outer membrane protein assembly factor BamA